MWRALWLLLALFAAPAQSAFFNDGFEARMPVSNWMPSLLEGAKDGALSKTVSSINPRAEATFGMALAVPAMDTGDFPTTPSRITGVEVRISALASHSGVSIKELHFLSFWQSAPSTLDFVAGANISTTAFDVGASGDLADAEHIAVGGYMALMTEEATTYGATSPVAMLDGEYAYYEHSDIRSPFFWLNDVMDAPPAIGGYTKNRDDIYIIFESTDGYDATLYIDSIEFRLHYEDASTAAMDASVTMTATLSNAKIIEADLSGALTAAATMNAMRTISASMEGSGKIFPVLSRSSGGVVYRYIMPELEFAGTMALTPLVRYAPVAADLSFTGVSEATLLRGHGIKASAPLAMTGSVTMSQALLRERFIAAAMTGSGTISAEVLRQRFIDTDLVATGLVTVASGGVYAHRPVASAMNGVGSISATLQRGRSAGLASTMDASLTMSATLLAQRPIAAAMAATGTLDAILTTNTKLEAPAGRTFMAPPDAFAFIAPPDFQTFEVTE